MKKTLKKHLKGVFLAILGLITGILCIILGIKMFKFFLPFIIGWILAMIASPLVEFLGKKIKDIKETYLHGDYYYGFGGNHWRKLSHRCKGNDRNRKISGAGSEFV